MIKSIDKSMTDYIVTHGKEKIRCTIIDINGVEFRVGNVLCDGKIYFVVSAKSKIIECMEIDIKDEESDNEYIELI